MDNIINATADDNNNVAKHVETGRPAVEQPSPPSLTTASSAAVIEAGDLRPTDVICGRGRYSKHPGNNAFLHLVLARKDVYFEAETRREKSRIARQILDHVHLQFIPPGRFVQLINGELDDDDAQFEEVEEVIAVDKIKQALRQKVRWPCALYRALSLDNCWLSQRMKIDIQLYMYFLAR